LEDCLTNMCNTGHKFVKILSYQKCTNIGKFCLVYFTSILQKMTQNACKNTWPTKISVASYKFEKGASYSLLY
jgi:hypothetical protein